MPLSKPTDVQMQKGQSVGELHRVTDASCPPSAHAALFVDLVPTHCAK
jgi:hypothetical protein